jgi:hypothetical protein
MALKKGDERIKKITNILINYAVVLMCSLTEVFSTAFSGVAKGFANGVANSFGASESSVKQMNQGLDNLKTQLPESMKKELVKMKANITQQINENITIIKPTISDPVFDKAIKIVESYNFGIPKFTEDLDESTLAVYMAMGKVENSKFGEMFSKLTKWQKEVSDVMKSAEKKNKSNKK